MNGFCCCEAKRLFVSRRYGYFLLGFVFQAFFLD